MLEWFTTIPGILIICGVILLVIAIVLFVLGSKKENKGVVSTPVNNEVEAPQVDVQPINEPVSISPVEVAVSPVVEPVSPVEPVVATTEEAPMVNNVEVSAPAVNESETIVFSEPVVDIPVQEEKPVTIYGGNDPLEATQALPKMDVNHVPYGGEYPEAKVVEPVIEQPAPTPVVETVVSMPEVVSIPAEEVSPVIEPISIPEPVVENVQPVETVVEQPTSAVEEL